MTNSLSVAIVELVGGHGGMNSYDVGLCKGLLSAGLRVSLYTCDETADPNIHGLHFCPFYKRIYGRSNRLLRAFRFLRGSLAVAWSTIRRNETVVHFHVFQSGILEFVLVFLMRICLRKVILTVHDVESLAEPTSRGRRPPGSVYRMASCLVVHNETSRSELIERLNLEPSRINVIPHGNYLHAISNIPNRGAARCSLELSESSKVILFFGQIKEVKGLDLLIEALPVVVREIPEVKLVIAGRPWKTEFSRYDALIDRLGLRDFCRIDLGYVSDESVARYFVAADVVALPYRKIYQSGALLLAMSYAKATVVSDLPGMTEIIVDRRNGYLFARESSEALAKALIRALSNDREREDVGARALTHVQLGHDWSQIGASTDKVYKALLSRARAQSP